jgi:hypothetical protein
LMLEVTFHLPKVDESEHFEVCSWQVFLLP